MSSKLLDSVKTSVGNTGGSNLASSMTVNTQESRGMTYAEIAHQYRNTDEGKRWLEMASAMFDKLRKEGIFIAARNSISEDQLLRVAHQLRALSTLKVGKMEKATREFTKAMSDAVRATSSVDNFGALFDFQNPTITNIAIFILETVVNADIASFAAVKPMFGMIDSVLVQNLVAAQARGSVAQGTIISGSNGEYVGGFSSNNIDIQSAVTTAATKDFSFTATVPSGAQLAQSSVFVKVVDADGKIYGYADDREFDTPGILKGYGLNAAGTELNEPITGTVNYSTGAITLTLKTDAPVGSSLFGVALTQYGSGGDPAYGHGVLRNSYEKYRLVAIPYTAALSTDTMAEATTATATGIGSYDSSLAKVTGVMNADYAADGVRRIKARVVKTYKYKPLTDNPSVDPNGSAKYAYARFNFLFAIAKLRREMQSLTGRTPNVLICGRDIASLLESYDGDFEPEAAPLIEMVGEHKIGHLKSQKLDIVISARNLEPAEALLVIRNEPENSTLVAGEFLAGLEGITIPGAFELTDTRASLKGFGEGLSRNAVIQILANGVFDSIIERLS